MKNLILYSTVLFFLFSCEDNRLENVYEDNILFVNSGKVQVSGFLSEDEIHLDIPIYRSGISEISTDVKLEIDQTILDKYKNSTGEELKLLPTEKYNLDNESVNLSGDSRSATFKLIINIKGLGSIQEILDENYAIPLVIKTSGIKTSEKKGEMVIVPILTGGIRPDSQEKLWSKTFAELDINPDNHFTASLAVTSKYLYINTRNEDLKFYDRFTGEYKGVINLPFKGSLNNFTITNDDADNLLITNLRNAGGMALQTIYKISNGGTPEVFINNTHEYPNGRKLSVYGDLNADALITSTVEWASKVLVWSVRNGIVQSQAPTVITLDANAIAWNTLADAIPLSLNMDDGFMVVGYGSRTNFGHFNKLGALVGRINLNSLPVPTNNANVPQSLSMISFNGARYIGVVTQSSPSLTYGTLVDITKYKTLNELPSTQLFTYTSNPIATTNNANYTADIQLRVANDKKSFVMYVLGTNGGVSAIKFTD